MSVTDAGTKQFGRKHGLGGGPAVLVGIGVALIVLAFLLAFTIFGEIAALAGVTLVAVGARSTGRRGRGTRND
jgi:hypothetical protein